MDMGFFRSFGCIPKSGVADSYGYPVYHFLRKCETSRAVVFKTFSGSQTTLMIPWGASSASGLTVKHQHKFTNERILLNCYNILWKYVQREWHLCIKKKNKTAFLKYNLRTI